ncbi:hypothetical protein ACEQ8H_001302 [Pleosporales sp. CAS-2024a]
MNRPQENIPPVSDLFASLIKHAATILGTIGTAAGVYRIWHNWRRKNTDGLPGMMLILWSICGVPFGVYAIVQNFNFALKFQPQAFAGLTLIAWGQTLYYHNKWRAWTATLATIALASSFAITEMILILTLRGPYARGVQWPMMVMAISASVIQVLGLTAPYFELAKRNGRVIGIDFWFLGIDYSGAFFSLMAVVAQQWFDALGASLYIACLVLETGIFAAQAVWLWRTRVERREAAKMGMTYDDYVKTTRPEKRLANSSTSAISQEKTFVDVEPGLPPVGTENQLVNAPAELQVPPSAMLRS